jgi:L-ascorbate metabolism protein UlaG (beta-lactamase superfamily)
VIVECLGHASLLVRTARTSVLFDPLLFPTHHEGLYEIAPGRELDLELLPEISAVVISHRHFDHFDVPSIAALPRAMPMVVPPDDIVVATVHELGFENVLVAETMTPVVLDDLQLLPTPASNDIPENGYVISDGVRAVWNVVDTSPASRDIAGVRRLFPRLDLAIAPWQPLLDADVSRGSTAFPQAAYARLLENVIEIDADTVALGACGFRATARFAWLNHLVFPVTPERFTADLLRACPRLTERVLHPVAGDAMVVSDRVELRPRSVACCRARVDEPPGLTAWMPWAERFSRRRSELTTEQRDGDGIRDFMRRRLPAFVRAQRHEFFWQHAGALERNVTVVFRDGDASWTIDFSDRDVRVHDGASPRASAHTVITADALVDLLEDRSSWSVVVLRGDYWEADCGMGAGPGAGATRSDARLDPLHGFFGGDDRLAAVLRAGLSRYEGVGVEREALHG